LAAADFERPLLEPVLDVEPRAYQVGTHRSTNSDSLTTSGVNVPSLSSNITAGHPTSKDEQFEDGLVFIALFLCAYKYPPYK